MSVCVAVGRLWVVGGVRDVALGRVPGRRKSWVAGPSPAMTHQAAGGDTSGHKMTGGRDIIVAFPK